MAFRLASDGGTAGNEWIVADGEIVASTPADFLGFLKARNVTPGARYEVYLNSPGGSLIGGIRLGEAIRHFGFGTRVAASVPLNFGSGRYQFETDGPGECYSACAFTFLGGKWRIAQDRSLGVHQHYMDAAIKDPLAKNFSASDLSVQQALSGLLADYVVRMGVDARFLTRASSALPSEIYLFPADEMNAFGITWDDVDYSDWVLEPYKSGLVAASRTRNAENVATLFCRKDRVLRLLLSLPTHLTSAESVLENPMVNLFGTDIPKEGISARIENATLKIEFQLPADINPDTPKSSLYQPGSKMKGMGTIGANRFWFYHRLPDRRFRDIARLVRRNCF